MLTEIKSEMYQYYDHMRRPQNNLEFILRRNSIIDDVENFSDKNPGVSSVLRKSKLHTVIAEKFKPVIFKNSPFFYEMGLRMAQNWGPPEWDESPTAVMFNKYSKMINPEEEKVDINFFRSRALADENYNIIYLNADGFDCDHHTLNYKEVFEKGLMGIIEEIDKKLEENKNDFYIAAKESCLAMIKIAEKFADEAEVKKTECENDIQKKYMDMISSAARCVPKNPPKTFYEGLAAIWFLRECTATLEGIGISVLGRMDELLGKLYENDIKNGIITEKEARELIAIWYVPTDVKFFVDEIERPETSTCVELGGYDANGCDVFNEVTKLLIEVHDEYKFMNPKLNCRYSEKSPDEYLKIISKSILKGHNVYAFINDDSIIPSLMKCGFYERDARCYVNGGCQETMSGGMGHSAGAYYYLSLMRLFDLSLREFKNPDVILSDNAKQIIPTPVSDAETFEEFYEGFIKNTDKFITNTLQMLTKLGKRHIDIHPCPLFSSMQEGCLEKGIDYTGGGAKYNHSTCCLCGIGTLADSLYALKRIVFDDKELTLEEFCKVLENNWKDNEVLRQKCISLPKYGFGNKEVDAIAKMVIDDIDAIITSVENERGGGFISSLFVYDFFKTFGREVRATPDGRYNGDLLNQGISPRRLKRTQSITDVFETLRNVQYGNISGNAVLDIVMPMSTALNEDIITSFIRSAGKSYCPTVQLNILSVDELYDAQLHPEKHKDLMVRLYGLSVYFTALTKEGQDEIISRNSFTA